MPKSADTPSGSRAQEGQRRTDGPVADRPSHVSGWLIGVLRPIHSLLMKLYFRVELIHPERIPAAGPVLLVPTHRSRWDPVVLSCATRRRRGRVLRFMASHDEFIGVQGWLMHRVGAFAVNTQRPSPTVLRACRDLILAGEALVIFAEGTIFYYPPGNVHPIKPGSAWLALDCQERAPQIPLPIVPIRIVYSDRYPRFRTHVQIIVQPPIRLAPYLERPRREAIRLLTADLERGLGDVVNESLAEMIPPRPRGPVGPAD